MQMGTLGLTLPFLGTAGVEDKQKQEATPYQSSQAHHLTNHWRLPRKAKVADAKMQMGTLDLTLPFSGTVGNSANRTMTRHKLRDDEVRMTGKTSLQAFETWANASLC